MLKREDALAATDMLGPVHYIKSPRLETLGQRRPHNDMVVMDLYSAAQSIAHANPLIYG